MPPFLVKLWYLESNFNFFILPSIYVVFIIPIGIFHSPYPSSNLANIELDIILRNSCKKSDVVVHACNLSTGKEEDDVQEFEDWVTELKKKQETHQSTCCSCRRLIYS